MVYDDGTIEESMPNYRLKQAVNWHSMQEKVY